MEPPNPVSAKEPDITLEQIENVLKKQIQEFLSQLIEKNQNAEVCSEFKPPVEKRNRVQHKIKEIFEERVEGSNSVIQRTVS